MTKPSRWCKAVAAALTTFLATSCYYDPYASGGSVGTDFVYTSSDRWFYDPLVYCYYDRYRRCYYDPYLYGYYPAGYCPRPLYGAYHPGGWNGHGACPPPSRIRDQYLSNYQNRVDNLRASNYAWAQRVQERNDAATDAMRSRRAQNAANFQAARESQAERQQQTREDQAQRQQEARENQAQRQQELRDRPQYPGNRVRPPLQQPQATPQRQPGQPPQRPAYDQASNAGDGGARQAQIEAAQARQQEAAQARAQQQQERQARQSEAAAAAKESMPDRRPRRGE